MNYLKSFLTFFLFFNTNLFAVQEDSVAIAQQLGLKNITRETIDLQKKVLKKYFDRNHNMRFMVRTAVGVCTVALIAGAYYYYNKPSVNVTPFISPEDVKGKLDVIAAQQSMLLARSQEAIELERLREQIKMFKGAVSENKKTSLTFFKTGIKAVGSVVYSIGKETFDFFSKHGPLAIASGIATTLVIREFKPITEIASQAYTKFVLKPIERVCHPVDTVWFIEHHIPLKKTFEHAKITVHELPLISRQDVQEREHHISCLVADINILVIQYTKLAAFLEIQSDILMTQSKASGLHLKKISAHFIATVETFIKEISLLLVDQTMDAKISMSFTSFEEKIAKIMRQYGLYERAVLLDILPKE